MKGPTELLQLQWLALCARLSPRSDIAPAELLWHMTEALYAHPPRTYHTLAHVAAVLEILSQFTSLAANSDEVEFALFLHDAIYIPGRTDNEARSADAAAMFLRKLACDDAVTQRICGLILATAHGQERLNGDAALIADIDMAILAAPPDAYDHYAASIAAEYAFAGPERYRAGRRAFLEEQLARSSLFSTEAFRSRYEAPARQNIARELASI